jgi:hypothetical protein
MKNPPSRGRRAQSKNFNEPHATERDVNPTAPLSQRRRHRQNARRAANARRPGEPISTRALAAPSLGPQGWAVKKGRNTAMLKLMTETPSFPNSTDWNLSEI